MHRREVVADEDHDVCTHLAGCVARPDAVNAAADDSATRMGWSADAGTGVAWEE